MEYISIKDVKFPVTNEPEYPYLEYDNKYSNLELSDEDDYQLKFNNKFFKTKSLVKYISKSLAYYASENIENYNTITELSEQDIKKLTNIILEYNASGIFKDCKKLVNIPKSVFDTWDMQNVYDLSLCFADCFSLVSLDLSSWNTENVHDIAAMFLSCDSLKELQLSNWNTQNIHRMSQTFYCCGELTTLDLSNWDFSNVVDMSDMFFNCYNISKLIINNFNTSKVENMSSAFYRCSRLPSDFPWIIDCSSITDEYNMGGLFSYSSVKKVKLSNVKEKLKPNITSQLLRGDNTLTITFV